MPRKNTLDSYGSVAKFFHWLIFLLVAGLVIAGFFMSDLKNPELQGMVYNTHKITGITVLCLILLRLGWRLINPKPYLVFQQKTWEKLLEYLVHGLLYAVLVAMPITGLWMSTADGKAPHFFNYIISMPGVGINPAQADLMYGLHQKLAWTLIALVSLHVLAALKHHFYDKDNVLKGMMPKK